MTEEALTLYYSPGACSLAPHILLEEAGAQFTAERVSIADGAHRTPDYLAINRRARVPALRIGNKVLTENLGIMTYIAQRFPAASLLPHNDLLLGRVYERLSFFAASVHIAFAQLWRAERFADDATAQLAIRESGRGTLLRYFDEIDQMLSGRQFLVGDCFSVADTYPLIFHRWARRIGAETQQYPAWVTHAERLLSRRGVLRALAREGLAVEEFGSSKPPTPS